MRAGLCAETRWTAPGRETEVFPEPFAAEDGEVVISSRRRHMEEYVPDELLVYYEAQGPGSASGGETDKQGQQGQEKVPGNISDQDRWQIQGDYLVRMHISTYIHICLLVGLDGVMRQW